MELVSSAEQRGALFRARAEEMLRLAAGDITIQSQALLLCMAQGYREMAAKAQSRPN
jgi:hypothetical protein